MNGNSFVVANQQSYLATDFSIATQIVTAPFNLLTSNGMFWVIPNEIRKHSDDVYLDNKKKWWDFLGWF